MFKFAFRTYMEDLERGVENPWPQNWWRALEQLKFLIDVRYHPLEPLFYIVHHKVHEEVKRCSMYEDLMSSAAVEKRRTSSHVLAYLAKRKLPWESEEAKRLLTGQLSDRARREKTTSLELLNISDSEDFPAPVLPVSVAAPAVAPAPVPAPVVVPSVAPTSVSVHAPVCVSIPMSVLAPASPAISAAASLPVAARATLSLTPGSTLPVVTTSTSASSGTLSSSPIAIPDTPPLDPPPPAPATPRAAARGSSSSSAPDVSVVVARPKAAPAAAANGASCLIRRPLTYCLPTLDAFQLTRVLRSHPQTYEKASTIDKRAAWVRVSKQLNATGDYIEATSQPDSNILPSTPRPPQ